VTAIVTPERFEAVSLLIFRETTTIGFRYRTESRRELDRTITTVKTRYGPVRLKVSSARGEVMQIQPEYEDCRRLADAKNTPLKEIQRAALAAWVPGRQAPLGRPGRSWTIHSSPPAGQRHRTSIRRGAGSRHPAARRRRKTR
ncbi:MAG: nickel insertion protein, partial [Thermoplasmata archaeon]